MNRRNLSREFRCYKRLFAFGLLVVGNLSCRGESQVESKSASTTVPKSPAEERQVEASPSVERSFEPPVDADATSGKSERIAFHLTAGAAAKVQGALANAPDATHLIVGVVTADEKYDTGFEYRIFIGPAPSSDDYAMSESRGIKLAIAKKHLRFLNGTTIDYERHSSGVEGFKFSNPNEKKPMSAPGIDSR